MRVVFLAHFFPPMNSTGARRVVAFASNLAACGHDVLVITTTKTAAHAPLTERYPEGVRVLELPRPSELEVGVSRSLSPLTWRQRLRRRLGRWMVAVGGQLVDREIRFVARLLRDPRVGHELSSCDVLVSTSPPWATHLGGVLLSRRHRVPWVADYRDQFSGSYFGGSVLSRYLERAIDRALVRRSAAAIAVSPAMQDYYRRWNPNCLLVYNGFDPDLVAEAMRGDVPRPYEEFLLRYVGTYPRGRPPRELLQALAEAAEMHEFRFEMVGDHAEAFLEDVRRFSPSLLPFVHARPKVSSSAALRLMAEADCLVVIETWDRQAPSQRGVATTKIFEYMAVGRPVLVAATPEIEAVRIVSQAGLLVGASVSSDELATLIRDLLMSRRSFEPDRGFIDSFSRPSQALQLEQVLNDVVDPPMPV